MSHCAYSENAVTLDRPSAWPPSPTASTPGCSRYPPCPALYKCDVDVTWSVLLGIRVARRSLTEHCVTRFDCCARMTEDVEVCGAPNLKTRAPGSGVT